jgi:dTDP-4-dehydrorhamnose 3,5-epimerase
MSRFHITPTPLEGLVLLERIVLEDERGFLSRLFCADELKAAGWHSPVTQINHTLTRTEGTLRGMHYQVPPKAEAKLVSCIRGSVWDVAVDVRLGSPTYLKWHAVELSAANHRALLIPPGFAHGFQTLSGDCELIYLHSESYDPISEMALNALDPALNISWPRKISTISPRDLSHDMLDKKFQGVSL